MFALPWQRTSPINMADKVQVEDVGKGKLLQPISAACINFDIRGGSVNANLYNECFFRQCLHFHGSGLLPSTFKNHHLADQVQVEDVGTSTYNLPHASISTFGVDQ